MAASAGAKGSLPDEMPIAMAIGTTMLALAVLLVNSLVKTAIKAAAAINTIPPSAGSHWVSHRPIDSASPVENESSPIAIPPP